MVDNFPVFLKNQNDQNYYCILSESHFWEWQRIGTKGMLLEIHAHTLPDRWVIQDLLQNTSGNICPSDETEWQRVIQSS
jgi:hypothetical protein